MRLLSPVFRCSRTDFSYYLTLSDYQDYLTELDWETNIFNPLIENALLKWTLPSFTAGLVIIKQSNAQGLSSLNQQLLQFWNRPNPFCLWTNQSIILKRGFEIRNRLPFPRINLNWLVHRIWASLLFWRRGFWQKYLLFSSFCPKYLKLTLPSMILERSIIYNRFAKRTIHLWALKI